MGNEGDFMQDFTADLQDLKLYFSEQIKSPMISLPANYPVFDLSNGPVSIAKESFGIGKYAEHRPNQYSSALYQNQRDFHIGLDIVAPIGTEVFAPCKLKIIDKAYLSADKDYGHCVLGKVLWPGRDLFILVGHLAKSIMQWPDPGDLMDKNQVFAHVGSELENGGWFPHIHVQFSFIPPSKCDMPGVIRKADYPFWESQFPDPRIILGELYKE